MIELIIEGIKKIKIDFDFKGPHLKDILDKDFWNMIQVHIKGQPYAYSKTTRLLFKLFIIEGGKDDGKRIMELVAWKNKEGKFIPKSRCNKDIINWCKRSGIDTL